MPNCAKQDDCPRAVMVGCQKCEHYITPAHYKLIKKADGNIFKGFMLGVLFSVIVAAIIVYC